jgi:hypothetical protein
MGSCSKAGKYFMDFWFQLQDRFIIQVIPVVMCDKKDSLSQEGPGQYKYPILETFSRTGKGRGISTEDRIHEDCFLVYLHEIRRVSKPD